MPKMRVAVVGGAGRLGGYVVDELAPHHEVTIIDRVPGHGPHRCVEADITSLNALRDALAQAEAVIHVAGIDGHVNAAAADFFHVNVFGTWNVLQAASDLGIARVAVTSSTAATGLNATLPVAVPRYLPIDEVHPLAATDPYGLGKQFIEIMAQNFGGRRDIAVTCIRPTYIAFPDLVVHLRGETGPVTADTPQAFLEPPPLLRSYVDPRELARCYRLAIEREFTGFDVFWACASDTFEPMPTLDYVRSVYGSVPEIRDRQHFADNAHAGLIDCSKAARILGWTHERRWSDLSRA